MKLWREPISGKLDYHWMKKPFLLLTLLYALALVALFRADFLYGDDLGRAVTGNHGWLDWSRYVTMALSFLVHMTPLLTDISPLPQLLAVMLMALSGVIVIYTFTGKKEISWPLLAAALPMGLTPWFLQCFSYKFDAPYMAVSVLSSVLPFLWWEKNRKSFLRISFLCLLVMTMTYQAASGIFVIETLFLAFHSWRRGGKGKDIFLWMLSAAAVYGLALLTFKFCLQRPPIDGYVSIEILTPSELPQGLVQNALAYLTTAWLDLNGIEQLFLVAITGLFLVRGVMGSGRNLWLTFPAALLLLAASSVLSYGAYLVLDRPLLDPRGMLGMGIWISFVCISLVAMAEKKGTARWLVFLLAWQLVAGAAAYGDALAAQMKYTDFRINLLVQDLNTLGLTEGREPYHLLGDIGKAPAVRNTEEEYPAAKRLVPSTFSDVDVWSDLHLYIYRDLLPHVDRQHKAEVYRHLPVVLENRYHRIQSDGKDVLITLKESSYE